MKFCATHRKWVVTVMHVTYLELCRQTHHCEGNHNYPQVEYFSQLRFTSIPLTHTQTAVASAHWYLGAPMAILPCTKKEGLTCNYQWQVRIDDDSAGSGEECGDGHTRVRDKYQQAAHLACDYEDIDYNETYNRLEGDIAMKAVCELKFERHVRDSMISIHAMSVLPGSLSWRWARLPRASSSTSWRQAHLHAHIRNERAQYSGFHLLYTIVSMEQPLISVAGVSRGVWDSTHYKALYDGCERDATRQRCHCNSQDAVG
ncbi:hypothetical protein BC629DRAFT_1184466 [Irpex lacteus]|nr:hypothetical protein BC629DRAFT_1184466 [Irpex lacteus]